MQKCVRQYFYSIIAVFIIGFLVSCNSNKETQKSLASKKDSIVYYIKSYKNITTYGTTPNPYLQRAIQLNNAIKNDTLKKDNSLKIALAALKTSDTLLFRSANNNAFKLAINLKDTSAIAETHWNLGSFFGKKNVLDSSYHHYFKAEKLYSAIHNDNYAAKMLFNMAFLESRLKDYNSSEYKLIEAIKKYKALNKHLSLYKCYNMLGVVFSESGDFNSALEYHNKAFEALEKVDVKKRQTFYERNLNDLGLMYQLQRDHKNAIITFKKAFNKIDLINRDASLYARLIDNLGYSLLLSGDVKTAKINLFEALKTRAEISDISGISISKLHIAEYYMQVNNTNKALQYAKEAHTMAALLKNRDNELASLIVLSKIDKGNSTKYLNKHITLLNAIKENEKKLKNEFAKIRYETDEIKQKNKALILQKTLILTIAIAFILTTSLLYLIKIQKSKNKALKLEKEQRKATAEIYRLMLNQQSKLEEGRIKERHRISEELHDGILGKIFGTRMGLAFLDIDVDEITKAKHQKFIIELQNIEKEMRTISHDLKNEILTSQTDFISIVEEFAKAQTQTLGIDFYINRDLNINWNLVNDDIKINIYRVIQEALQNSIKHAKAKTICVELKKDKDNIYLKIEDNGKGFDTDKLKKNGIGLTNMLARVKTLGGDFTIKSNLGKGTEIKITIPLSGLDEQQ